MSITVAVVVLVLIWIIYAYNQLAILRVRVRNAWSQVEVQLRMRYDLIPNLVETVKGYATHEQTLFNQVTEARSRAMSAGTVKDKAEAETALTGALRSLFAVAEAYPALRASENFTQLQQQLEEVEKRLAYSRQFFNDTVLKYNTRTVAFPSNLIAGLFGFRAEAFFEAGPDGRDPVQVRF